MFSEFSGNIFLQIISLLLFREILKMEIQCIMEFAQKYRLFYMHYYIHKTSVVRVGTQRAHPQQDSEQNTNQEN